MCVFVEWVEGASLILIVFSQDDIIDDVESFVAAAEILKERGAYKIYVMATHGILSAEAPPPDWGILHWWGGGNKYCPSWDPEAAVSQDKDCGYQFDSFRSDTENPQWRIHGLPFPKHHSGWLSCFRTSTLKKSMYKAVPSVTHTEFLCRQGLEIGWR